MQKKIIALICFLILLLGAIFVLESDYGTKILLHFVAKSGVPIQIGSVNGRLPSKIQLENLTVGPLHAERLEIRLSLLSLLVGEIRVKTLKGENIEWNGTDTAPTSFKLPLTLSIDSFDLKNVKGFDAQGSLLLYRNGSGSISLDLQSVSHPFELSFIADGSLADWSGEVHGRSDSWLRFISDVRGSHQKLALENLELVTEYGAYQGKFDGTYQEKIIAGNVALQNQDIVATSLLSYHFGSTLTLSQIHIESPRLAATGELSLSPDLLWVGSLSWNKGDLSLLSCHGQSQGKIEFSSELGKQAIELAATANEIYAYDVYAQQGRVQGKYVEGIGKVEAQVSELLWQELALETGSLNLQWDPCGPKAFHLLAQGSMRGPLEIDAAGEWDVSSKTVHLESAQGTLFGLPLETQNDTIFQWSPDRKALEHFNLTLGDATIAADYVGEKENAHATASIQNLPLDILSPTHAAGALCFTGTMTDSTGNFDLTIPAGNIKGQIASDHVTLELDGSSQGQIQIPLELRLWPPHFQVLSHQSIEGQFNYNGRIENLLDPFDLASHYVEGDCQINLKISGTLSHPELHGSLHLEKGSYQNYWSGTELQDGTCDLEAQGDRIVLQSLKATDPSGKGSIQGTGSLLLDPSKRFPYHIDFQADKLNLTQIDLVHLQATGTGEFLGDTTRGKVQGTLTLNQGDLHIPDRISKQLPHLQVIYKNGTETQTIPSTKIKTTYPIDFHLNTTVPEATIEGRGLQSEWKGNFILGGTAANPAAKGKIELSEGEFVFSGRTFKLTEGSISMDGLPDHAPQFNLAGVWSEKGISILVQLKGPLNEPQITFQSTPPLPFNGILSYLLFGQDISEITPFQALQLVNSAATLSGGSPDILETTRKSLGIDRLRIISRPSLGEGEDSIALQVGQYVAEGIIISVSQGPEQSSTNISIEVDLSHGFVFQAETIQEEEQGKFTVKWNRNY